MKTETRLPDCLTDTKNFHPKIGRYEGVCRLCKRIQINLLVWRDGTYVLARLLDKGVVNHIFAVRESTNPGTFYEYAILHDKEELISASKTKYYPVTLATVMPKIHELRGKVAVVGIVVSSKPSAWHNIQNLN